MGFDVFIVPVLAAAIGVARAVQLFRLIVSGGAD